MKSINTEYEIILVDNGSKDESLKVIKELCSSNDLNIKYISLTKNFGHQGGLYAGMDQSSGQAIITLDCDLQHPPELISEMLDFWKSGFQVVSAIKKPEKGRFFKKFFYKLINLLSNLNLAYGQSDFRLIDQSVLNQLRNFKESKNFIRGLVDWMGFKHKKVLYDVQKRRYGITKFNLFSYFKFALKCNIFI